MDWLNVIISSVCALLGALGGAGGISIIFYQQTKRMKEAEALKAESEVENDELARWRVLADKLQEQLTEARNHIIAKNGQVDELYDTQHNLENSLRMVTNKYNSSLLFIDYIKHNYCIRRPCELGRVPENVPSIDDIENELMKKGLILSDQQTTTNTNH